MMFYFIHKLDEIEIVFEICYLSITNFRKTQTRYFLNTRQVQLFKCLTKFFCILRSLFIFCLLHLFVYFTEFFEFVVLAIKLS